MRTVHLLVMIAMMQGLASCGQKGPLILPDAQHPHKKPVSPKPPPGRTPSATPASPAPSAPPQL